MTLTFTEARIQMDSGVWLCLKVNEPAPARTFILDKQNRIYDCEIKEHREKRSLDANAYCWVLLDKLADAIRSTKEEIYLQKVREIGIFRDFILEAAAVKTFRTVWERHFWIWVATDWERGYMTSGISMGIQSRKQLSAQRTDTARQ